MLRIVIASIAVLYALAAGACSEKHPSTTKPPAETSASTANLSAAAATTNANAPLYPDWAQTIVPPYPNATVGFLVNTGLYQIQSTDDLATVHDWYKSRVNASWKADSTTGNWSATVNGLQIAIYKNPITTGDASRIKTMIGLSRR